MPTRAQASPAVPRLTYLRIKNYRALRDVEFRDLTPLTVLIGPNGSGKSTVLDALDFLAEAVRGNLVGAWEDRERFRGMQTQGSRGLIEFEVIIQVIATSLSYKLSIDEDEDAVFVSKESMSVLGEKRRDIFSATSSAIPLKQRKDPKSRFRIVIELPLIGVKDITTSEASQPFITRLGYFSEELGENDWHLASELATMFQPYRRVEITDKHLKGYSDLGARERLSANGENLTNVLYYLANTRPKVLATITEQLRRRIPSLSEILMEKTSDERLLLRFRDAPFDKPFPARAMSGGTLKLTALFTLLYEPHAEGLLAIEEPENEL